MVKSYLIYLSCLFVCFWIAHIAEKRNNIGMVCLIILFLTLLSGLRNPSVGFDTSSYYEKFEYILRGRFEYAYGLEESFKYIVYFILKITNNKYVLMGILALITHSCILFRLWDFRNISSFCCMVSCYYTSFYFLTLNCVRQFCAVAIVFYFSKYIINKNYLKYIIGVCIAFLFHKSAVVAICHLLFILVNWKFLSKHERNAGLFMLITLPITIYILFQLSGYYSKFLSNMVFDIGLMMIVKLIFLIFSFLIVLSKKILRDEIYNVSEKKNIMWLTVVYFVGLFMASLGYIFVFVDRISWYFYLFECVYFGILVKARNRNNRLFCKFSIILLTGYAFFQSLIDNSQGIMPYLFFWE